MIYLKRLHYPNYIYQTTQTFFNDNRFIKQSDTKYNKCKKNLFTLLFKTKLNFYFFQIK